MPQLAALPASDILNSLHEGLYVLDRQRRIVFWNHGAESITGFDSQEVIGKCCADNILIHVDEAGTSLCGGFCPVAQTMDDGQFREAEVFLHHKQGHRIPVAVRVTPLRNTDDDIIGAVEIFADNSSHREERFRLAELEKMALVDGLTQLPNRRYMEQLALSRLAEFERAGWNFGVLMLDLDHFKKVNDTHGHNAGDQTLRTVAKTISHVSRPYDVVGRWGGEEFLALVPNVKIHNLRRVAERYRALVARSQVDCNQKKLYITASLGGTMVQPGDDLNSLVDRADRNLYQAKEQGRDRTVVA